MLHQCLLLFIIHIADDTHIGISQGTLFYINTLKMCFDTLSWSMTLSLKQLIDVHEMGVSIYFANILFLLYYML